MSDVTTESHVAKAILLTHSDGKEEIFDCIADACRKYNLNPGYLCWVALDVHKYHKGFTCEYLTKEGT